MPTIATASPFLSPVLRVSTPELDGALRSNLDTYTQLARPYGATGHARLVQARRWLRPVLDTLAASPTPSRVLELGSADGVLTGHLTDLGHDVTAVEFAPSMAELTASNAPTANIIRDEFLSAQLDRGYDVILCSAFVHLFPPPWDIAVLEKVAALLAPGGVGYVASTVHRRHSSGFEEKTDGLVRYRTRYTVDSLDAVIDAAGLATTSFYTSRDRLSRGKTWANWIVTAVTS